MKKLIITICLFFSILSLTAQTHNAYTPSFKVDGSRNKVNNVILLIGDGMGLAQITAGLYANHGELTLTNLRSVGFVLTQSLTGLTTDSAAAATAYSTGHKTYNGAIGVDADTLPLRSITEFLAPLGWRTGVLTTDFLDGATPSSFYAHQKGRRMATEIFGYLPNSSLSFFGGGSLERVMKKRPQLLSELATAGWKIADNCDVISTFGPTPKRFGVIAMDETVKDAKLGRGDFLPRTAEFAFGFLKSLGGKGFFIMVEGAKIDWGGHDNDFEQIVAEMLDFDVAVEAAIRFAEQDKHTLVIITADHETGGLSIAYDGNIAMGDVNGKFASTNHTPIPVPLFAYGPYSDLFRGMQDNTDIPRKIVQILTRKSLN